MFSCTAERGRQHGQRRSPATRINGSGGIDPADPSDRTGPRQAIDANTCSTTLVILAPAGHGMRMIRYVRYQENRAAVAPDPSQADVGPGRRGSTPRVDAWLLPILLRACSPTGSCPFVMTSRCSPRGERSCVTAAHSLLTSGRFDVRIASELGWNVTHVSATGAGLMLVRRVAPLKPICSVGERAVSRQLNCSLALAWLAAAAAC